MGGRASSARAGAAASRANTAAARDRRRMGPAFNRETGPRRAGLYNSYSRNRIARRPEDLAATDRTRITKPSPIVEDDQGQLRARKGVSREVIEELSKVKGEPTGCAPSASSPSRSSSASPCRRGASTSPV